jgi:hypothetical protein
MNKIKKVIIEGKLPDSCSECTLKSLFKNVFEEIMICNLIHNGVCVGTYRSDRHPDCPLELFISEEDGNCDHDFILNHWSINGYVIFACKKCKKEIVVAPEELDQFTIKYKKGKK